VLCIPLKPKSGLTPISCHAALERSACAPFIKERRMERINATSLRRKSGQWGTHPSLPAKHAGYRRQVEKEMTPQKSPWMRGPEGRSSKLQPSPEGLGGNPEDDLSAVGGTKPLSSLPTSANRRGAPACSPFGQSCLALPSRLSSCRVRRSLQRVGDLSGSLVFAGWR
jgi:hypothetical protein